MSQTKSKKDVILPRVTYGEASTIIASLRVFQTILRSEETGREYEVLSVTDLKAMEHFEDTEPLASSAIDKLVARINTWPANVNQRAAALQRAHRALREVNHNKRRAALADMVDAFRKRYE
jgi:hypothetical protein